LCLSAGNRRNQIGKEIASFQPKSAQSDCTELSDGAPDSVRCARLALANRLLSGLRRRCTAIIHRTVRWCTGLSGESTVSRGNGRPRIPRVMRGRANGHIGAPCKENGPRAFWLIEFWCLMNNTISELISFLVFVFIVHRMRRELDQGNEDATPQKKT
jgi:hypothetical protein